MLKSDWLTQGPMVSQFECELAKKVGCEFAVAVNSATSALHIACLALDLGPGDWLWTSPITFVASANCALYCGAKVDFVDIDINSYNMSVDALAEKLELAEKQGTLPKVLIPVHFAGQSCDMEGIYSLAQRYGVKVIEDASHAIGGRYKGQFIGDCLYSDITIFSFHPVKIITTAEGGMAVTSNRQLAERMQLLRSHGITRDTTSMSKSTVGSWHYQQLALGYNYRLTDLQAALGVSQLKRLDEFVTARHQLANQYNEMLTNLPVVTPRQSPDSYSGWHLYVIRLKIDELHYTHLEVFEGLRSVGIGVNLHYIPVYHQPYYEQFGFRPGYCPAAEQYYSEAISLPIYPALEISQQQYIVDNLTTLLRR